MQVDDADPTPQDTFTWSEAGPAGSGSEQEDEEEQGMDAPPHGPDCNALSDLLSP